VFGVDCIREGVAQVSSEDRSAWPSGARTARLIELRELEDLLHAQVLRAVADSDAVDAWHDDCLGSVSWLASKTGLVRNAAARLVKTARFVARHQQTAKALDAGDVTVSHVELLAAAADRRDDLYEEYEAVLLDAAATVEVQDFPQVTRRWMALADEELARRDAAFAFERRGITISRTTGGAVVSGFLDPEAAATVARTLDDLQPPEGRADTRSLAQRRADAMVLLCERARGGGATCPRRGRSRAPKSQSRTSCGPVARWPSSTACSARSRASVPSRAPLPNACCAIAPSAEW